MSAPWRMALSVAAMANAESIAVNWPAPRRVRAVVTTRHGGVSEGRYASFNLATHCGDEPWRVAENRHRLAATHRVPPVCWLSQVHGTDVVDAGADYTTPPTADAAWSRIPARACAILTADCLPVLICDRDATLVAAAHCGWRGLAQGILRSLVGRLGAPSDDLLAWLGPAIGPAHYEVGEDVRDALLKTNSAACVDAALLPSTVAGKWQADLYAIARAELSELGVTAVYGGGFCTYRETRFYSYRRDGVTGRMASLIWLSDER
jgi:polyphenol oxidase